MKNLLVFSIALLACFTANSAPEAPKGHMIYCCYANTRNDGWGRNFCELINENGKTTVVVYLYNRQMTQPDERHYEVTADVAEQLERIVRENKFYEIDGYKVIEHMIGGTTKRVYMEFDSGEHYNAEWFAEKPDKLAVSAYTALVEFFQPWVEIAEKERKEAKSQSEESVDVNTDSDLNNNQGTSHRSYKKHHKSKSYNSYKRKSTKRSRR